MIKIEHGATPVQEVLDSLESMQHFQSPLGGEIEFVNNHKGSWVFGFESVPSTNIITALIALFDNKYCYDGISAIVFFYGTDHEVRFEDVAGDVGNFENKIALFTYVYKIDRIRFQEERIKLS